MKIAIGSDHAGFDLKSKVIEILEQNDYEIKDCGTFNNESCDYPDYGHAVAKTIKTGDAKKGIVICGSGNGINMAVNKHDHIRGALCWKPELAALAVQHNKANVLALPARFIDEETAVACVKEFLSNTFEGGRHERRVNKI